MPPAPLQVIADHGIPSRFARHRLVVEAGERGAIVDGFRLWWAGLRHPVPGPYVTIGSAHGFVLAALQWLASPVRRRRPHVMFDLLLERRRRGFAGIFDRLKMALFARSVDAAMVWGEADIDIYAREYGIDRSRFHFQPFHITLEQYQFEIRDEGYVFAGGNHGRDYATLIEALAGIDYPVFIATQKPHVAALAAGHPHITVQGVSHEEFRQKMAASTLVVEAHPASFFRTAGHQTFLNAMWMGKPFVMADRKSAIGYFEDEKEWLVTEAGDVEGLRARVRRLLDDRALAARIAAAGQARAREPRFGTLNCMQQIYNRALALSASYYGLDEAPDPIAEY